MAAIAFAGTPDFARESLRALVEAGYAPDLVLTQPDRPAGRGKKLRPGPVKQYALANGLPVSQPLSLREPAGVAPLREIKPDLLVVAAYGLILPQDVLDVPAQGCVNVHASLLPRWRGAAPIQCAILAGDRETGCSLMRMEAGLDSGPVFASESLVVGEEETAGELHDRLATLGGELLVRHLDGILDGSLPAVPQVEEQVTYAPKIRSADAAIDWHRPADELVRLVRAYNPVPGAFFDFHGERIKCWKAQALADQHASPGKLIAAGRDGIDIACGEGTLRLLELQRPGRKRVSAREFADQLSVTDSDGRSDGR